MQLSLLWLLSFGSCTSGKPRRTWTVKSVRPAASVSGLAFFHSAMMTTVAGPIVTRGSWYGVRFMPRVTISRMCTPSPRMSFAASVA